MAIKQTAKYVAALDMAKTVGVGKKHKTGDELYSVLEAAGYSWSSPMKKWYLRPVAQPQNEVAKTLVRVRITGHNEMLYSIMERVKIALEQEGFRVAEISKMYINDRPPVDGSARYYLTCDDLLVDMGEDDDDE